MIEWSIRAAKSCGSFDRIIVSTDSKDIANLVEALGAEVPFMRPDSLADDYTSTIDVVRHALGELPDAQNLCCLYATAPFVSPETIREARTRLIDNDFVIPVTTFDYPIQRGLALSPAGRLSMLDPSLYGTRSQDLEEAFHDVGQFYWAQRDAWLRYDNPYESRVFGFRIPRTLVQDIDTEEDWDRAELLFKVARCGPAT